MCEHPDKSDVDGHQQGNGNVDGEHQDKRSDAGHQIAEGRNHDANDDQVQKKSGVSYHNNRN